MAWWVEVLAAKAEDVSSVAGTPMVDEGNRLTPVVFGHPHVHCGKLPSKKTQRNVVSFKKKARELRLFQGIPPI